MQTSKPFERHTGHVIDKLRDLPAGHAQCIIISPPYFGLRDYGLEPVVYAPMLGLPDISVPADPVQGLQNALWQAGDNLSRDVLQCARYTIGASPANA